MDTNLSLHLTGMKFIPDLQRLPGFGQKTQTYLQVHMLLGISKGHKLDFA